MLKLIKTGCLAVYDTLMLIMASKEYLNTHPDLAKEILPAQF